MLTPEQLSACTDDIVELYRQLDDSIVQKIVKAIAKGTFTEGKADLVLRLQQSGKLYDDIVKEVAKYSGLSDEAVRVLFEDASVQSVSYDNKIYNEAGLDVVNQMSPAALRVLEANIEKTGAFLTNLTKTTATTSQQAFISACTLAEMQIESGAMSYTEAVRQAIHSVIENGAEVLYPSGHRDKLDVAVRRAALTGVGQTTGEISRKNAEDLGCDLMEITAHFGARPSHAEWQGKIVSLSGRKGYLSTSDIGYGTGTGFKGYNCRHDWFPFFEGISEKAYSDKELEQRKNETVTYDDKTMSRYDAEQKQRAMERQIRKERSKLVALDTAIKSTEDEELKTRLRNDFNNLSVKLKSHETKYKDFSYKTGLPPQKQRLQMYGFGRSVSQKAVHANKSVISSRKAFTNPKDSDIINVRNMANGHRRSHLKELSDKEKSHLISEIAIIGADTSDFEFGDKLKTAYSDDLDLIIIGSDVFPSNDGSLHPRDLMSERAVLAHEYYGHKAHKGTSLKEGSWNDEFRASYMAAKNCPNLSAEDRRYLILDALERAREKGVTIKNNKFIREVLYGG